MLSRVRVLSRVQDPKHCFAAGIFKTTDGGKSFQQVLKMVDQGVYPNDIECSSADHCVATLESGADGYNCSIITTTDGGKTWQTKLTLDGGSGCAVGGSVRMQAGGEIWITGGFLSNQKFEGHVRARPRAFANRMSRAPECKELFASCADAAPASV